MTIKTIEKRFCDLCESEDGKNTVATHQYASPDLLDGWWFDGCKKHTDQMRVTGGYKIRRVRNKYRRRIIARRCAAGQTSWCDDPMKYESG